MFSHRQLLADFREVISGDSALTVTILDEVQANAILNEIGDRFLIRGRKDLNRNWIWEAFKNETAWSQPVDCLAALDLRLDDETLYWFVACDESGGYLVVRANREDVSRLISQLSMCEYLVVAPSFNWLICENHHGVLIEAVAT